MKRGVILLLLSLCASVPVPSRAAKPVNWRAFRLADGMPSVVCSSVTVDLQGKVLVTHPDISAFTEFDGYTIRRLGNPLPESRRFYVSPAGQLWALNKKGLNEYRDGEWILHGPKELGLDAPFSSEWIDSPVICPIRQGVILLLLPDRLVQFTSEAGHTHRIDVLKQANETALGQFNSIVPARNGGFWVSGTHGVARLQGSSRASDLQNGWEDYPAPAEWQAAGFKAVHQGLTSTMTLVAHSVADPTVMLIVTFDGQKWVSARTVKEPIRHAWQRRDAIWAITDKALLQYSKGEGEAMEVRDLPVKRYFDVATEPSGAFWLATSDGLLRYASLLWEDERQPAPGDGAIRSIAADPEIGLWYLTENGLHWWNEGRESVYPFPRAEGELLRGAKAVYPLKKGVVAIQTAEGLMTFDRLATRFQRVRATEGGDEHWEAIGYIKESVLGVRKMPGAGRDNGGGVFAFDGASFAPARGFPEKGFEGITGFLMGQTGNIWISGQWGTAWWHENKWRSFSRGQNPGPIAARAFVEAPDGTTWCAAAEGVWQFDGKSWHLIRQDPEGANALIRARDGSIWAASKHGVARFWQGAWIEHGVEEGLPTPDVAFLCEDKADRLWAVSTNRLSVFQPKADLDPPRTSVQLGTPRDSGLYEGGSLTVLFQAQDKWKFTVKSRLLYSYHLDGRGWSAFGGTDRAIISDLSAGKHYFQVRSMDRNGNIDSAPASFEFNVLVPWFRESRLVVISATGAAVAIFFAALALNRHRRLLRSYAEVERKVAERTLELEKAHRELLHNQKMTALGTLSAGIAHDFNNILSIIKGSAQIIEENLGDSHKVETRLERIKTVVEQGAGIVKAMLGFSRESAQESEPCDINETVRDTIRLLGDRFVREVEIRFEPERDLPAAPCSKDLVQQILLNFVFNAVESATSDNRINIMTHASSSVPNGAVLLPGHAERYVNISVRDRGAGIAPEVLPRVFEPFFTTKALSSRRGTGLGLSMVYEFAKKLNAGLAVESIVGEGSTFTLILPAAGSVTEPFAACRPSGKKPLTEQPASHS